MCMRRHDAVSNGRADDRRVTTGGGVSLHSPHWLRERAHTVHHDAGDSALGGPIESWATPVCHGDPYLIDWARIKQPIAGDRSTNKKDRNEEAARPHHPSIL